ncbi:MAG: DUF4446 family protein [Candidatus Pacebacteria bacterium]|nr:DUF4446 family protein [Candidatus Paceibacterota bacterium]
MLFNFPTALWVGAGVLFVWLLVLTVLFFRLSAHYRRLGIAGAGKDLKSVLEEVLKSTSEGKKQIENLLEISKRIEREGLFHLQQVGLVRFNPFAETGGDQSFCLALLDDRKSGLVISSLHSRETTRIYAKPVKEGKEAGYSFSEEEGRAIKEAKKLK